VVRRDTGNVRKVSFAEGNHLSTEPDRVDKVYNIRTELLETTDEAQARKVKLQSRVHQDGNAKGADNRVA